MTSPLAVFWQVIIPILIVAGAGALLAHFVEIPPMALSRVVFYILAPALIFSSIYGLDVNSGEAWRMLEFGFLYGFAMLLIAAATARAMGFDRALTSAFSLTGFLVNSGNYGLPLALFAFGEKGLQWAVLFYLTNSILSNSLGVFVAARGTGASGEALINLLSAPGLYAAALAALARWIGGAVPEPVSKAIGLAGDGAVPVMLVLLGVQLTRVKLESAWKSLGTATVVRMLVGPAVGAAVATLVGLRPGHPR